MRVICNWGEKKNGFRSGKKVFSLGSAIRNSSLLPESPLPGEKSIRLAKKGGDSSFLDAGFRRSSTANS